MTKTFDAPLYAYSRSPDQDEGLPVRHPVVVIGAGPVGLATALDLAQQGVKVVLLSDGDHIAKGSRAFCFGQRPLEILDRLGCGHEMMDRGLHWSKGKVFLGQREIYDFAHAEDPGHKWPAFLNLQQNALEEILITRIRDLQKQDAPIEIRGGNKVEAIGQHHDHVTLEVETPEGSYTIEADWLVACDGANSPTRRMLGIPFNGTMFEDNFLIADIEMTTDRPAERWFWFDPPFNQGQSALLQKQPDNLWRIDLQLGPHIDKEQEARPENVISRLRSMLGNETPFTLKWASVYSFQCCRMENFVHGRTIFAGDSAHQVSPFGARGANAGLQDADNIAWKIRMVLEGRAPAALIQSYHIERARSADENMQNSVNATEFITPKSEMSRILRDAVLTLAKDYNFARSMVNSGRLTTPSNYDTSPLNSADALAGPDMSRPGSRCPDAPLGDHYLLDLLGNDFTLLTIDADAPDSVTEDDVTVKRLALSARDDISRTLTRQFLGDCPSAVYLIRPDQHIAARRESFDDLQFRAALRRATGKE
ncbi:FAD-dependent oxidoreductase [Shimia sp. R11_0]|uniref:FAD-dependent oxidoreductase n=1 Tax=Shimia sp. R11_0 TaxID=2821096 RepID=UPI001ADA322E|nr:FAD-dependent oxidoreductase [Shimia sp. R11_0]MBO9478932.1 FAD-dependent oxidoreductase [Shimia sp. R11_0]